MNAAFQATQPPLRGRLRHDVSLAGLTAWGVGGRAERVYEPGDLSDLSAFLRTVSPSEPLLWLGLGSNVLVRDAGVRGTVILTLRGLHQLTRIDGTQVRAEAGVTSAKLARFCAAHGLVGAEFFAGIPGTVGGALAMNAGAFGGETWPLVRCVGTIDRAGVVRERAAEQFTYGYRELRFPPAAQGEWFVGADLELRHGDVDHARAEIRALLKRRAATQPTGQRSCGSVFRNPAQDFAGRLIESAGMKGTRVGGALVSSQHANFIINDGSATAGDVEALIAEVAAQVEARHGVRLVPEVRIVGERGNA